MRETDRTNAHLTLLRKLSDNAGILVPELIPPKDFADLVIHIEAFVNQASGAREGSAIDVVQRFLSGESEVH